MVKTYIPNENKEDKFKRIASSRTQKILYSLKLLGNCANNSVYSYNDNDINQIFKTIEKETKRVKSLFNKSHLNEFKL